MRYSYCLFKMSDLKEEIISFGMINFVHILISNFYFTRKIQFLFHIKYFTTREVFDYNFF